MDRKHILSERDNAVLRSIYRYGYPSTRLVKEWHFANIGQSGTNAALYRLNDKTRYIERQRLNRLNTSAGGLKNDILFLNKKGANYVKNALGEHEHDLGFRAAQELKNPLSIPHREKVIDIWRTLEHENEPLQLLAEVVTEHHRYKNQSGKLRAYTTIENKDGSSSLTADLLCCIAKDTAPNKQQFFCIEVDMGTETIGGSRLFIDPNTAKQNSLISKYRRYEAILADGGWTENIPTTAKSYKVLTITTDQKRINAIKRICSHWLKWTNIFLFATFEDVKTYGIYGECWQSMRESETKQKMTDNKL